MTESVQHGAWNTAKSQQRLLFLHIPRAKPEQRLGRSSSRQGKNQGYSVLVFLSQTQTGGSLGQTHKYYIWWQQYLFLYEPNGVLRDLVL